MADKKIKIQNQDFVAIFKTPNLRDNLYSVEISTEVAFLPKTWFDLYHFENISDKATVSTAAILDIFKRCKMSKSGKEIATALFNAKFGKRKTLKKDEWWFFCQSIKSLEKEPIIASAYFSETTGKKAYLQSPNFTLKIKINPETKYLQGLSNVMSVNVSEGYRGIGLSKKMYQLAEKEFGLKIIPASPLSDGGKYLHKSLGNIA